MDIGYKNKCYHCGIAMDKKVRYCSRSCYRLAIARHRRRLREWLRKGR